MMIEEEDNDGNDKHDDQDDKDGNVKDDDNDDKELLCICSCTV